VKKASRRSSYRGGPISGWLASTVAGSTSPPRRYRPPPRRSSPRRRASDRDLEYREATRRFQRRYLLDVLTECDWGMSGAVRRLGLARSQLYNLIAIFELKRPKVT
jgi:transcriptional regulator with GAF, ATPase, and Fis domain